MRSAKASNFALGFVFAVAMAEGAGCSGSPSASAVSSAVSGGAAQGGAESGVCAVPDGVQCP